MLDGQCDFINVAMETEKIRVRAVVTKKTAVGLLLPKVAGLTHLHAAHKLHQPLDTSIVCAQQVAQQLLLHSWL